MGQSRQEGPKDLLDQSLYLKWWALDSGRDAVSKLTVDSQLGEAFDENFNINVSDKMCSLVQ